MTFAEQVTRRSLFRGGLSLGWAAFASLGGSLRGATDAPALPHLHHAAKAKRVIFLYQAGGPSHLETFDPKPKLAEMHGKPMPDSFTNTTVL